MKESDIMGVLTDIAAMKKKAAGAVSLIISQGQATWAGKEAQFGVVRWTSRCAASTFSATTRQRHKPPQGSQRRARQVVRRAPHEHQGRRHRRQGDRAPRTSLENMGACAMVREVASKAADAAGDGTTTATVALAAAIIREGARSAGAGEDEPDGSRSAASTWLLKPWSPTS